MELLCSNVEKKIDTDQLATVKRKRAPNFTNKEIHILMKLIQEHIHTVESGKTDAESLKKKVIAWNKITEHFNNNLETTKRSSEALRQKYDNIKKNLRRKESKNKEEENNKKPEFIDLEDYEKELLAFLEQCGENSDQLYEASVIVLPPENRLKEDIEIKIENDTRSSQSSRDELEYEKKEERFIVTDDDFLWDLPDDMENRPKMFLLKRQLEQLERDEQRKVREHEMRMKNEQIKRRIMLNREDRAKEEHKKKMELLALEIDLKKRLFNESNDIS